MNRLSNMFRTNGNPLILAYCIAGFFAVIVSFSSLLLNDPLLFFDDNILIDPLRDQSFSTYLRNLTQLRTFDFQPIRDFLFMLEIRAQKHFSIFHTVSLLLGIAILYNWCEFTNSQVPSKKSNKTYYFLALTWIFTHGAWVWSLCWVSAQKHLLSVLFLGVFLNLLVKIHSDESLDLRRATRLSVLAIVALLCSLLSHPMFVAASFVPLLFVRQKNTKNLVLLALVCVFISLITMGVNWYYYNAIYPNQVEAYKFGSTRHQLSSETVFQFGRYFYNLVLPTHISASYWAGAWQALVGIPIGLVVLYGTLKFFGHRKTLFFFSALLIPFVMTAPFQFNIFHSDTYLLLPILAFAWFLVQLQYRFPNAQWAVVVLIAINLVGSVTLPASFHSDGALWVRSYEKEKSPMNLIGVVTAQLQRQQYKEAQYNLSLLEEWHGEHPRLPTLNCAYASTAPDLPTDERIHRMKTAFKKANDSACAIFLIHTLQGEERYQEAIIAALNIKRLNVFLQYHSEEIAAKVVKGCEKIKVKNCSIIKEHFINLTINRANPWNDSLYQSSLTSNSSSQSITDTIFKPIYPNQKN